MYVYIIYYICVYILYIGIVLFWHWVGASFKGDCRHPQIMGPPYGKLPILLPYHSHICRDSNRSGMGIVWVWCPINRGPWKSHWFSISGIFSDGQCAQRVAWKTFGGPLIMLRLDNAASVVFKKGSKVNITTSAKDVYVHTLLGWFCMFPNLTATYTRDIAE